MKDLLLRADGYLQIKYENLTSSFGRLRQKLAPKSVQDDYFFLLYTTKWISSAFSARWLAILEVISPGGGGG